MTKATTPRVPVLFRQELPKADSPWVISLMGVAVNGGLRWSFHSRHATESDARKTMADLQTRKGYRRGE